MVPVLTFSAVLVGQNQVSCTADAAGTWSDFSCLKDDQTKFYLIGEHHDFGPEDQFQLDLLTHLVANKKVRYIFIEGPTTMGYLINQYLKTGDSKLIEKRTFKGSAFWKQIYEVNNSLESDEKVEVFGTDFDLGKENKYDRRFATVPAIKHMLEAFIKETDVTRKYIGSVSLFTTKTPTDDIKSVILELKSDLEKNRDKFEESYSPATLFHLETLVNNKLNFYIKRDGNMMQRIQSVYDKYGKKKSFIVMGLSHVMPGNSPRILGKMFNEKEVLIVNSFLVNCVKKNTSYGDIKINCTDGVLYKKLWPELNEVIKNKSNRLEMIKFDPDLHPKLSKSYDYGVFIDGFEEEYSQIK